MCYKNFLVYFLVFSLLNINACSHSKAISNSKVEKEYIPEIGDIVVVVLNTGDKHRITLTHISDDSLKSVDLNFAKRDIQRIKKIDKPPYLLIGIIVGVGFLYFLGKSMGEGLSAPKG